MQIKHILYVVVVCAVIVVIRRTTPKHISLVVSWVDGTDKRLYDARQQWINGSGITPNSQSIADYRIIGDDELKYLLRSVDAYAPWIHQIFIVTSFYQKPAWLKPNKKLTFINDTDIIPSQYLPTFNSHVIESYLHNIPGLTEYYIYANDDMFFGNHVTQDDFFYNGKIIVYTDGVDKPTNTEKSYHKMAWNNNYKLLLETYGAELPNKLPCHQMTMTSKTLARNMFTMFQKEIVKTSETKFRHETNIHPMGLQLYSGLCDGSVVENMFKMDELYTNYFKDSALFKRYLDYITACKPKFICVNNVIAPSSVFKEFAEAYYPVKSQYEL